MIEVKDKFVIGQNTSITINGNGEDLKQGETLIDAKGIGHKILSIAMVDYKDPENMTKSTTVLVDGIWND